MPEGDFSALVCAGIDWCVQQNVDVINLSLGPDSTVFNPDDPLQRATKAARDHGVAVVVAAGNFGPGKMQSLARAPWVISVGAVDDKERLLSDSSTGASDTEGPTVVSYGAPLEIPNPPREWETYGPGTSFAAPRVSRVAGFVRACLRLINRGPVCAAVQALEHSERARQISGDGPGGYRGRSFALARSSADCRMG